MNNMEKTNEKQIEEKDIVGVRLQTLLDSLTKCKIGFINERDECKKIREINSKLELELKETRELEKSHRYHLLSSREMIGNLQETVSQLVHIKRDMKKLKDEILSRDITISTMEKDKENLIQNHNDAIAELRNAHERHIGELAVNNERKIQQVQQESDTQIAQFTCAIEELRTKMSEMEAESRDKMNVVVLEYEEKIQRGAAQVAQLQEQLARQAARTDANIDAYKRRLEELKEKLKQSQFKQYLAQSSYTSQYDTQGERPYSAARDPYPDYSIELDNLERNATKLTPMPTQNKAPKQNTLQVIYYGNNPPPTKTEKKGQFNISKKRKLYNDKDFQDF